jgi:hypothetical protein
MQHVFGTGSVFLAASFDDDSCFLTQVVSGVQVDNDDDVSTLMEAELKECSTKRSQMRLQFPGVTALNFEMLSQTLVEEVVCWDMRRHLTTKKAGYFGGCLAFSLSVEEQGWKTLHGHMTAWIAGYKELQRMLFFEVSNKRLLVERTLQKYFDRIATTEFFGTNNSTLRSSFQHDCVEKNANKRPLLKVVDNQALRGLHHISGYKACNGVFAECEECNKKFTCKQLVTSHVTKTCVIPEANGDGSNYDVGPNGAHIISTMPTPRIDAEIVKFQKTRDVAVFDTPTLLVNGRCQHHRLCRWCFCCKKSNQKGGKHVCGPKCECRCRLLDKSRLHTSIKRNSEGVLWHLWNGNHEVQPLLQFLPKWSVYNLFQNTSCQAVSKSKFAYDSNVSVITDGPIAQYQFKCHLKGTQEKDTAEYAEVDASMKKMQGRLHEDDKKETLRIICRAAFVHNKTNVISPPLASCLTRNKTRFYFSHDFVYCPLNDVMNTHSKQGIALNLQVEEYGCTYFENQPLNYLC